MTRDPLAADDPHRRTPFRLREGRCESGDWSTAAELFEQALEPAPHWAAAWFALGEAREEAGRSRRRGSSLSWNADRRPDRCAGGDGAPRAHRPRETRRPGCRRPMSPGLRRVRAALRQASHQKSRPSRPCAHRRGLERGRTRAAPLRLGPRPRLRHGTDGAALRDRADRLTGVDLSPAMIAKARERDVYDDSLSATRSRS